MKCVEQKGASDRRSGVVLDAIFTALGVDDDYLIGEQCPVGAQRSPDTGTAESEETTSTRDAVAAGLAGAPTDAQQVKPWVLHVDDDTEFTAVLRLHLERAGILVTNAFDGRTGIRKALVHSASAIILDYAMPGGRGDFVLGRLKENSITRDIPVIVLTGYRDRFLERRLLGMGAAMFLTKPLQFDVLLDGLQRLIGERAAAVCGQVADHAGMAAVHSESPVE